jgi:hypothetical protein
MPIGYLSIRCTLAAKKKKKEAKRATEQPRKDSATKIQRSLVGSYDDVGVSPQLRREVLVPSCTNANAALS